MKRLAGEVGKMPREVWPMVAAHWSDPKSFLGMASHFEALPENAAGLYAAPPLDGIPAIALTSGSGDAPGRYAANLRHIVASKSGHWIHLDEPELVVEAVRDLIAR